MRIAGVERARKAWLAIAASLVLVACGVGGEIGTGGQRLLPPMPGIDATGVEALIASGRAPRIQFDLVDAGRSALLVAAGGAGGVTRWRTVDNTQIYTRDGLVVGTRGLSFDLMTADTAEAAAAILAGRPAQVTRFHTYLDGDDRTRTRAYVCDVEPRGAEETRLPDGRVLAGLMVRETCHNPERTFTNLHLLSNGRIVRTLQFISDRAGRAQILFPPSRSPVEMQ